MRRSVLVIEDHAPSRDLLVQLFEDEYDMEARGDGASGLEAVAELHPDIVLLDLSLPVIDGWEVARRIRADPSVRDVWIVALTAHAMPEDRDLALQAGCDVYLTKPVDEGELRTLIEELVNRERT